MKRQTLMVHGCWLVAVAVAFGLGAQRRDPSQGSPSVTAPPTKGVRAERLSRSDETARGTKAPRDGDLARNPAGISSLDRLGVEELAQEATRNPNPIERRLAFSRLLESLTPENALAIREQLVAAGTGGADWRDFNYRWGAIAGQEVVEFAATTQERDLNDAMSGWASANPTEALALLDNLPEGLKGSRESLAASVVEGLSHRDPGLAANLVLRLAAEGSKQGEKLMELVAREALRTGGYQDAAAWSETLPDGPVKAAAMDRIAGEYVRNDPEAAAAWAQGFATEDYAARVIEEVGDGLARRDPGAAATWLESLPEGRGQADGLQSVFGDWEDRDPAAAVDHLLNMPRSSQRDTAISGFSKGYAWQDPQTAIAWAEDISDPGLRQETLTRAGQAFFRKDPDSARTWLESSALPDEARKAIQNPPRR